MGKQVMTISGLGSSAFAGVRNPFQPPSFASLDTNNDAQITLDELKAGAPGGASAKSDARLQALFKAMDTDGNGSVSADEKSAFDQKVQARRHDHHAGLAFMAQQLNGQSNADVFAATDTNGDGSVSLGELSDDPAAAGQSTDSLQKLFSMIDSNGDGSISQTESSDFLDKVKSAVATLTHGSGGPPPLPANPTDATDATSPTDPAVDPVAATDATGSTDPSGGPTQTADAASPTSLADSLIDLLTQAQTAYSANSNSTSLVDMLQQLVKAA